MKKQEFNEGDLARLTDEIRKLGVPFEGSRRAPFEGARVPFEGARVPFEGAGLPHVSSELGPQYWANFRMRVMDRIEAREQRGIRSFLAASSAWLSGHLLETGLAGAAAALVIFALTLNPFASDTPATGNIAQAPSVAQPQAPSIQNKTQAIPNDRLASAASRVEVPSTEPKHSHNVRHDAWMASHLAKQNVQNLEEMAAMDDEAAQPSMITTESDYPVSLNELSPAELQAVLNSMEHGK
jgi:hypothetical protein